jgi:hypothetical protein
MSGLGKRDRQPYFDGSDTLIRYDMFGREFALMPGLSAASTASAHDCPLGLSTRTVHPRIRARAKRMTLGCSRRACTTISTRSCTLRTYSEHPQY